MYIHACIIELDYVPNDNVIVPNCSMYTTYAFPYYITLHI